MASHDETQTTHHKSGGLPTTVPLENSAETDPNVGRVIGNCRILRKIGSGGMGVVYAAEQQHPRRQVALKLIRSDRSSEKFLRRFNVEAEVLGRMQHPCIASIFESGIAKDDRGHDQSYIVMEFIDGTPLSAYIAINKPDQKQRMALLAEIAGGVAHAHRKGIIHRDLKPANILMTRDGRVKIVDFGIARIDDPGIAEDFKATTTGMVIGTPAYMSPEQVHGRSDDIDTRCDVYALGIIGYEMVTGRNPFDLAGRSMIEALKLIESGVSQALRRTHAEFRGDLGVILFQAMSVEPDQRYSSAADFAADLLRYLDGEAITARPASLIYQLQVFSRRHRGLVVSSAITFFVMMVATVVSVRYAMTAHVARDAQAVESAKLREINKFFLEDIFGGADPEFARGKELTVRNMVDIAAARVSDIEDVDVRSAVQHSISGLYLSIGVRNDRDGAESLYERALMHAEQALSLRRNSHDGPHPDIVESLDRRGSCLSKIGRYGAAVDSFQEALAIRALLGMDRDANRVHSELGLVTSLMLLGRVEEANKQLIDTFKSLDIQSPDDPDAVVEALILAGDLADKSGDIDAVEKHYRRAVEVARKYLSDRRPKLLASSLSKLGHVLIETSRREEGRRLLHEALELRKSCLPAMHTDLAESMIGLASSLAGGGEFEDALRFVDQALSIYRDAYNGKPHHSVAAALLWRKKILAGLGRHDESLTAVDEAIGIFVEMSGPTDLNVANARSQRGEVLKNLSRFDEGKRELLGALDIMRWSDQPADARAVEKAEQRLEELREARRKAQSTP